MTDESPDTKAPSDAPEGVFGNLPSTRPGSRSPRRKSAGGQTARGGDEARARRAAPPPPPPPPPATPEPPPGTERETPVAPSPSPQRIGSVEDLAWAGVAVAAHAATAGVRFASRALEAARKSIDRP